MQIESEFGFKLEDLGISGKITPGKSLDWELSEFSRDLISNLIDTWYRLKVEGNGEPKAVLLECINALPDDFDLIDVLESQGVRKGFLEAQMSYAKERYDFEAALNSI